MSRTGLQSLPSRSLLVSAAAAAAAAVVMMRRRLRRRRAPVGQRCRRVLVRSRGSIARSETVAATFGFGNRRRVDTQKPAVYRVRAGSVRALLAARFEARIDECCCCCCCCGCCVFVGAKESVNSVIIPRGSAGRCVSLEKCRVLTPWSNVVAAVRCTPLVGLRS